MTNKVTKKIIKSKCYKCHGKGFLDSNKIKCYTCNGTGVYIDYEYYFTNGKIYFNGDTLK